MNKIGIYFAFWEKEWEADYCRYIEKAKNLGFDVLELAAGCLPDMTAAQRREIASRAEDAGIDLTYCIGLPLSMTWPVRTHLSEHRESGMWENC